MFTLKQKEKITVYEARSVVLGCISLEGQGQDHTRLAHLFHVAAMACLRAVCAGGGAAAMEPSVVLVIDGEASQPPRRTATTPVSTAVCTAVSTAVAGHSALVAGALITVLYTVVAVA